MRIALIGWQSGGKSSLFKALTGVQPAYGEEAFQSIADIPDVRIDELHKLYPPAKKIYARVEYLDIAGLAHDTERTGFKRSMMNHIQGANVLCAVIGTHLHTTEDEAIKVASQEIADIEAELILSDLQIAESRKERIDHAKQRAQKVDPLEERLIDEIIEYLNEEKPLREMELLPDQDKSIRSFAFLSRKPLLIAINVSEDQDKEKILNAISSQFKGHLKDVQVVDAATESEIASLDEDDRAMFLEDLGIEKPASEMILRASYDLLGYISFFTVGDDEVRAWPIPKGMPAVEAAGTIHSDLQRGFIRAEVVSSKDLLELGALSACRDKGLLRLEGKTYEVADGDVMHIRFAV